MRSSSAITMPGQLDVLVADRLERTVERLRDQVEAAERGALELELLLEVGPGGVAHAR